MNFNIFWENRHVFRISAHALILKSIARTSALPAFGVPRIEAFDF